MNNTLISDMKQEFGGEWVGIRFNSSEQFGRSKTTHNLRVCAAVKQGMQDSFVLPVQEIDCMGGQRSMGLFETDKLIQHIHEETGLPLKIIQPIVKQTPSLNGVYALELTKSGLSHIVLSYCSPPVAMNILRRWQTRFPQNLLMECSTFLAICGNMIAFAQKNKTLCLSLGCPTSRRLGILEEDEIVVGMPTELAKSLCYEID